MAIWTPNTPGSLSNILTGDDAQDEAMRSFEHGSTEPATKVPGLLWSCTNSSVLTGLGLSTHALLRWNGSAWQKFLPGFGGVLPTVSGGFMDLGGAVPSNLGAPSNANHAARNGDVLKKDGSVALTGDWDVGARKITNLAAPTNANDAARLADLNAGASGTVVPTGTAFNIALSFRPRWGFCRIKLYNNNNVVHAPIFLPIVNTEVIFTGAGFVDYPNGVGITACDGTGASPLNFTGLRLRWNTGGGGGFGATSQFDYQLFK
jgi:hypothetical protein